MSERPTERPSHPAVFDAASAALSPTDFAVWSRYRARWNEAHPERGVWASDATIGDDIGVCEDTVRAARHRLIEAGWLHQEPDGRLLRKWATMPDDVAATIPEPRADDSDNEKKAWKCLRRWRWHGAAFEAGRNEHGPALRWERPAHDRDEKKRWIYDPLDDVDVALDKLEFDEARRIFYPTGRAEYRGIFGYGPDWKDYATGRSYKSNRTGVSKRRWKTIAFDTATGTDDSVGLKTIE